jgi:hypothetical protein
MALVIGSTMPAGKSGFTNKTYINNMVIVIVVMSEGTTVIRVQK